MGNLDMHAIARMVLNDIEEGNLFFSVPTGNDIVNRTGELTLQVCLQMGSAAGGSTTRVQIDSDDRVFYPVQAPTATAPTAVKGGIFFDTTRNKLQICEADGTWLDLVGVAH